MSAQERLPEYALGTLEPAEAAEVEALLERSADARAELRSLRAALVGLTEALPPAEPPAYVWAQLQAKLEPDAAPKLPPVVPPSPRRPWLGALGWTLAACLALIAVGEGLWLSASRAAYRGAERDAQLVAQFLAAPQVDKRPLYGRAREGLGSVLARPDGEALFVLGSAPPNGQSYQAWGHTSGDWEPGSGERLTSLGVSGDPVFAVSGGDFTALYLSLEPEGGSPQPTHPLSRVSLAEPVAAAPLEITSPADGAVIEGARVIVTGVVAPNTTNLSYALNGETRQTTTVGNRFTFTATLRRGLNTLVVRATGPEGTATEALTLRRP